MSKEGDTTGDANNDDDGTINVSDMTADERNDELLECARYGEDELMMLLIGMGADVNHSDEGGSTAVHKAAANGQVECLQILIKAGAIHKANGQGNYPIHWAAQNGQADALKLLLDSYPDADVLAQNGNGISTLTEAFNSNKQEILEICLSHSSASDDKLMAPIKGKEGTVEEEDVDIDIEKHAVIHKMNLSEDQGNNAECILIRELPITRADNPFGSDDAPEDDSTGLAVWPASIILARWAAVKKELIKGKVVIELGAGCGLPGLAAARYADARVTFITDIHDPALKNAAYNVQLNSLKGGNNHNVFASIPEQNGIYCQERISSAHKGDDGGDGDGDGGVVQVCKVNWKDMASYPPERADVIIGSDLVYDVKILSILVPAVKSMLVEGGSFLYCAPDTERDGMSGLHVALEAVGLKCVEKLPCPDSLYSNPLVATQDSDDIGDLFILHFYDMSIKKAHTLYHYVNQDNGIIDKR